MRPRCRNTGRRGQSGVCHYFLSVLRAFLYYVTQSHNLRSRYVSPSLHGSRSAHSESDEAHSHGVEPWRTQSYHVGLSFRAFRNFHLDGSILCHAFRCTAPAHQQHRSRQYAITNCFFHKVDIRLVVIAGLRLILIKLNPGAGRILPAPGRMFIQTSVSV